MSRKKKKKTNFLIPILLLFLGVILYILGMVCGIWLTRVYDEKYNKRQVEQQGSEAVEEDVSNDIDPEPTEITTPTPTPTPEIPFNAYESQVITWNPEWEYANFSILHTDSVTLYKSLHEGRKVIAINAGHGTSGGNSVRTQCHPDGTPKVTGGSTKKGSLDAAAVSSGTTMLDGTREGVVNLKLAMIVKEKLLNEGFSVLMIRETDDVQIDNIARTVFANQNADCHIALHYDSSDYDKGFFYIGVPDVESYRNMEPVASHWQEHNALGESLLAGMRANDVKIHSDGNVPLDLTQTSYSTVPSVDVEVGDRASDYSDATLNKLADGIVEGVKIYFADK